MDNVFINIPGRAIIGCFEFLGVETVYSIDIEREILAFSALEVFQPYGRYSKETDIWAFGMAMFVRSSVLTRDLFLLTHIGRAFCQFTLVSLLRTER